MFLLIPNNTLAEMRKLPDVPIQRKVRVLGENNFVSASSKQSILNIQGWHALKDAYKELNLQRTELINPANNRHRISTIFTSLTVPDQERELFYKHMGHSEEININVYQAPLAETGVKTYGKHLWQLIIVKLLFTNIFK